MHEPTVSFSFRNLARRSLSAMLCALALPSAALADDVTDILYSVGDPAAGEAKYAACAACHGPRGVSTMPSQPSLAGQHPEYLFGQLRAYKGGERVNAIMQGMVANLSEDDMVDLAVYLHRQPVAIAGAGDRELAAVGRDLYRGGVAATGAPSCMGCHGPAGRGIPPVYPRLGGQHAEYLVATMLAYRDGSRAHAAMGPIASRLTEEQIRALAEYISGLH